MHKPEFLRIGIVLRPNLYVRSVRICGGINVQIFTGQTLNLVYAVCDHVRAFRQDYDTPILLMTYWNPILQYGIAQVCTEAKAAGVDGFLISDLPPEEAGEWLRAANAVGLDTIFLLAPTSPESRIRLVTEQGSGFTYCISRLGVTGAQAELPPDLFTLIDKIKALTDNPVAVGFGISTPQHVAAVCTHADGAIVGSALVKIIAEHADDDLSAPVTTFVRALKDGTRKHVAV
jgi:tryptophan synthase alpha chain